MSGAIKELVENALDADATSIEVKTVNWGIDSISVIGKRHFTSKIRNFQDSFTTKSFGFRGEAVSSLCTLSDFSITTCTTPPLGWKLTYDHSGELAKAIKIARSQGTTVSISNLFGPLPVRQQEFKKNAKKNFFKCVDLMSSYCLAYPKVRFQLCNTLSNSQKSVLVQSVGSGSILTCFSNLFGAAAVFNLVPFERQLVVKDTEGNWNCSMSGHVSKPKPMCGRGDTDRQFLFVNRYPMEIPKLVKAINSVYRDYNATQYPSLILFLDLPMERYDRNVSPDKRALILQSEDTLISLVRDAFSELFEPFRGEFQNVTTTKSQAAPPSVAVTPSKSAPAEPVLPSSTYTQKKLPASYTPTAKAKSKPHHEASISLTQTAASEIDPPLPDPSTLPFRSQMLYCNEKPLVVDMEAIRSGARQVQAQGKTRYDYSNGNLQTPLFIHKKDFGEMKVLGQFNLGFILVSFKDHLFIVDQHASQEKFLFEKYRDEALIRIQPLIRPTTLFLTPQQEHLVMEHQALLKRAGFDVQQVSEQWLLTGVPQMKNTVFGPSDFEEILALLADNPAAVPMCKRMEGVFASKACRSAVMIGDPLKPNEMQKIISSMMDVKQPWNCPHGRPTIRLLTEIIKLD
ncbi:ATP-binding mismatch repair protein [Kappamyces sp. JEL0829]|nr:ATP-binding mismatch repair protein [Kappamyces sp. JEL0829]